MKSLIRTEGLKKYFKTPNRTLHAVDGANTEIERGQIMGIVGESGCGKSIFGQVMAHPHGSIGEKLFFENQDIMKVNKKQLRELRNNMQMIFQDPYASVSPRVPISTLIVEPLWIAGNTSQKEIAERVDYLTEMVGLVLRLRMSYSHESDGGRRQRVAVVRAITLEPKFITCDEPVFVLDVSIRAQILNLLQDLQGKLGLTYMFITHDLSAVKYIFQNILATYLGQEVEKADPEELFQNPLHPYTKALFSAVPVADIHYKRERIVLNGELTSPTNPASGCRFASRCIYVAGKCFNDNLEAHEASPGHYVACHLFPN